MPVRIRIDRLLVKRLYNGQPNAQFDENAFAFRDDLISEGALPYSDGTYLYCDMESVDRQSRAKSPIDFNMNDFNVVVTGFNGKVYDFWPFVKILTTDMQNSTPVGLINSIKPAVMSQPTEEDDETFVPVELEPARQKTWYEWANLDGNYQATAVEDHTYFGAHFCAVDSGRALGSDELMIIVNAPDAELVDSVPIVEI